MKVRIPDRRKLLMAFVGAASVLAVAASVTGTWNDLSPYSPQTAADDFWDVSGHEEVPISTAESSGVGGVDSDYVFDSRTFSQDISNVIRGFRTDLLNGLMLILR